MHQKSATPSAGTQEEAPYDFCPLDAIERWAGEVCRSQGVFTPEGLCDGNVPPRERAAAVVRAVTRQINQGSTPNTRETRGVHLVRIRESGSPGKIAMVLFHEEGRWMTFHVPHERLLVA